MPRFAFFYLMSGDTPRIRSTAPSHVTYWKDAELTNYMGGPFADRSGGLITFDAGTVEDANARVQQDPFLTAGLLANFWVKEWLPE